jgi:hypothetical protein
MDNNILGPGDCDFSRVLATVYGRSIYLGEHNGIAIFTRVSVEDYEWACQWRWRFTMDKRKKKYYATRNTRIRSEHRQVTLFLHKEILIDRMHAGQPSYEHHIGDHGDGDSLNNVRTNLSWATASDNCKSAKSRAAQCPVTKRFIAA